MRDDLESGFFDESSEANVSALEDSVGDQGYHNDFEYGYGIDEETTPSRQLVTEQAQTKSQQSKKERIREKQKAIKETLKKKRIRTARRPIISIDTEYEQEGEVLNILSYQYVVSYKGQRCEGIIFTQSGHKKHRLSFEVFLTKAIQHAIQEKVLTKWPEHINLVAHYLKADLFTFSNAFKEIKTLVSSVRKTVASLRDGYGVDLSKEFKKRIDDHPFKINDGSNNTYSVWITFYDTMLFAPAGYQSLKRIGELVGHEKKDIPQPYDISRMAEYLEADRQGFTEYAITDAVIACKHFEQVVQYECIENGNPYLPFTIGSLAVKSFKQLLRDKYQHDNQLEEVKLSSPAFKNYFHNLFGKEKVTSERWVRKSGSTEFQPITDTKYLLKTVPHLFQQLAIECYHGGRNECYVTGPTQVDTWNDFDAPSCYTVILNGLRPLDFDKLFMSKEVDDFKGDVFGLLRVKFSFPEDTNYPSLPVRADPYGLVYPLNGICFCTAAELEVACDQGATIEILQGIVIPWQNDERIFTPFMKEVRAKRQHYKAKESANDFLEKFWKEKGNSLYGRLAMSLRPKRVFDIQSGNMKYLEPGELTNAYFAAYVSGTARALLSALINGVPKHRQVIALTTDGFITNATNNEIDKSAPVCQRFKSLFHMIEPEGGDILEEKHRMQQVIAMKTRGYTTAIRDESTEWSQKYINARAGVQQPEHGVDNFDESKPEQWVVNKYLERTPESDYTVKSLTPSSAMFLFDKDMVGYEKQQVLNYEPDYKRDLIPNGMVEVNGISHIQCLSKPHRNVAEMKAKRAKFDAWRESHCLKTLDDWEDWQEYFKISTSLHRKGAKGNFMNIKKEENSGDVFKRLFLRVWVQEACGVEKDMKQNEFAAWLSSLDDGAYLVKPVAVSSAKKEKVIYGKMPATVKIARLLQHLIKHYPKFEYELLFKSSEISELKQLMQNN